MLPLDLLLPTSIKDLNFSIPLIVNMTLRSSTYSLEDCSERIHKFIWNYLQWSFICKVVGLKSTTLLEQASIPVGFPWVLVLFSKQLFYRKHLSNGLEQYDCECLRSIWGVYKRSWSVWDAAQKLLLNQIDIILLNVIFPSFDFNYFFESCFVSHKLYWHGILRILLTASGFKRL